MAKRANAQLVKNQVWLDYFLSKIKWGFSETEI